MPHYQNSDAMPPLRPKPKTEPLPCSIHRIQIPDYIVGDGKAHTLPCQGLTRILKVATKTGRDMHMWYMSSPEKTAAIIDVYVFPTGVEVPNNLSYVDTVIWPHQELVWHVFVDPKTFPEDRPYITH